MKNLIPQFIYERYAEGEEKGCLTAYTMSIDLSGFTALTDALMRLGPRGAEQLSNILNEIFAPLVKLVYSRNGFIPYFAGDAFTAIFPLEGYEVDEMKLLEAAQSVRNLFRQRAYQFDNFTIGLKIGLAYGEVEWGIVGSANNKAYYFRGMAIDSCNYCQTKAHNQDIILDEALHQQIDDQDIPLVKVNTSCYRLDAKVITPKQALTKAKLPLMKTDILKDFLPESVLSVTPRGEFRTTIAIFLAFDGISSHKLMNEFSTIVLDKMRSFSGYFKEIDFGDKGGVMVGFFGAPVSFENNVERALEFIYSLRTELKELESEKKLQFKTGITVGTAYTGIVGGEERCQYAAVGNRVNLAARLMVNADWGEVLVDSEIQKEKHFSFQHKGDIKYKGIEGNVPTFKLIGRNYVSKQAYSGIMVGREEEFMQLMHFSRSLFNNRVAGIAYIYGEAGIGKSRLTHELKKQLTQAGNIKWHICQTDQILRKPFNPFIYFLKNYFEQSPDGSDQLNREKFEKKLEELTGKIATINNDDAADILKELYRTRSVLAALIGITYENSIWLLLDAKGKYQNSIIAIVNLLKAESLVSPMVIQMEDGHWIDENSEELMADLVRQLSRYAVLLLVTSRYRDDGSKPHVIDPDLIEVLGLPLLEVNLNYLTPTAVKQFAETILQGKIAKDFYELLLRSTNSNPFYLEQILGYFDESKLLSKKEGQWTISNKNIRLSNSITAVLTARIDRLSSLVKETVKAAAVIGREFELPILTEVMREHEEFRGKNGKAGLLLKEQISTAEKGQIWHAMNELRYIFRHSLLREAAYSMQLRGRLRQLHRLIAEAIERLYQHNLQERFVDLAFHYEQADVFDKTCEYLHKAADYARSNFQNQQALDFYEKLLEKLNSKQDSFQQIQTQLKKGRILELIGKWDDCEAAYRTALEFAKKSRDVLLIGKANNGMGTVFMLKGDYYKSMDYLKTAALLFESIDNKEGISEVYGNLGNLYFRQGDYSEAKSYFAKSIDLAQSDEEIPVNAQIVANLGLTYMNQGNYDKGIQVQEKQLNICEKNNDKQGMATILTFLGIVYLEKGDYKNALDSFERGLQLSEELGNRMLMPVAIGNIGVIYERKGDYDRAMEQYQKDLELCEELGDKQGIAIALGLIGQLLNVKGEFYRAIEYLQKDLMISEELNYKKGIAKALNTLGDVFYLTGNFSRSLHFYDRAIEVTREIGNKLVLGFSLVEKSAVLMKTGDRDELMKTAEEATQIADELGNPDLIFEADILAARIKIEDGLIEEAKNILRSLHKLELSIDQEAAVAFEWHRLNPMDEEERESARKLYEQLYQDTPRYTYKVILDLLEV